MLSRRLIRIKVFKVLFSNVTAGDVTLKSAQNELMLSCEKTQELSMFMLNVAIALKNAAEAKIELGLKKFQPTPEEASPNRKFAENKFVQLLLENEEFLKYCQNRGLIWNDELLIYVRKLFNDISQKEYFQEYMNSEVSSFEEDCNIFSRIFEEEFEDSEELYSFLEDMSVYWIDDIDYVLNIILRIIASVKKDKKFSIPSVFIKEDDKEYATQLLDYSLTNYQSLLAEVSKNISNWDSERLVATDITIIIEGIAEAIKFPSIPIKVTINEYVEISKFYSTPNSKTFVNGLLDKIIQQKVKDGEIVKSGRGLIEA